MLIPVEPSILTSHIFCIALPMKMYECHIHSNLNTSHVIVIGLSQVLYHEGRGLFFFIFFLITSTNSRKLNCLIRRQVQSHPYIHKRSQLILCPEKM